MLSLCLSLASNAQAQPKAAASSPDAAIDPVAISVAYAVATRAHSDRMTILVTERNRTAENITQAKASGDKAALARSQADLATIDREIAMAEKEPVYPVRTVPPATAGTKSVAAKAAASKPTSLTYESWDVFKNFGQRGTDEPNDPAP